MESSIAVFLMRQLACEQLPTSRTGAAGTMHDGHLACLHGSSCHLRRQSCMSMLFCEFAGILAEGAMALSVALSGGVPFANGKLLQILTSLIVKVILVNYVRASAQLEGRCINTDVNHTCTQRDGLYRLSSSCA